MKKALIISGIVLFLAAGIAVSLLNGTTTLAEICDIEEDAEIVSVKFTAAGQDIRSGKVATYTEGAVYEKYVALFYEEKFHFSFFSHFATTFRMLEKNPTVQITFDTKRSVLLVVPQNYGKATSTGELVYAILLTATDDPREEYWIAPDPALNPSEIERLARAGNE